MPIASQRARPSGVPRHWKLPARTLIRSSLGRRAMFTVPAPAKVPIQSGTTTGGVP